MVLRSLRCVARRAEMRRGRRDRATPVGMTIRKNGGKAYAEVTESAEEEKKDPGGTQDPGTDSVPGATFVMDADR
jgi:hypothetical protein